jgi:hypothetical protein
MDNLKGQSVTGSSPGLLDWQPLQVGLEGRQGCQKLVAGPVLLAWSLHYSLTVDLIGSSGLTGSCWPVTANWALLLWRGGSDWQLLASYR